MDNTSPDAMSMAADSIPGQLTAACQSVRAATPADAVAGVQPWLVAAPTSTSECAGLLRAAADLRLAVVPRGTGSRMHWGNPPQRCDLVIEMTGMDRVVEHAAGDLVATVEAGLSLERLASLLRAAGQRLALDPPARELPSVAGLWAPGADPAEGRLTRGTVGGVLATGVAGPLRLRYGSPRDLLIGITVVRADGTVARSGGKVVKNVAGYDLGKLFAGSRGTLGLITQATFRLHPVPAATAYVTARCPAAAEVCQPIAASLESALAPVAVELDWPTIGTPVHVGIALDGDAAGVAERAGALADGLAGMLGRQAVSVGPHAPAWWGAGRAAQADGTVLQVAFWPGDLGVVLAALSTVAQAAGLDPAVGGSAAAGVLHVALPADRDPGAIAAYVAGLRGAVGRPGQSRSGDGPPARANVVVLHAPPAVGALVDLFGPVPSLALMLAVKNQFDPGRLLAPGRFAGGI